MAVLNCRDHCMSGSLQIDRYSSKQAYFFFWRGNLLLKVMAVYIYFNGPSTVHSGSLGSIKKYQMNTAGTLGKPRWVHTCRYIDCTVGRATKQYLWTSSTAISMHLLVHLREVIGQFHCCHTFSCAWTYTEHYVFAWFTLIGLHMGPNNLCYMSHVTLYFFSHVPMSHFS